MRSKVTLPEVVLATVIALQFVLLNRLADQVSVCGLENPAADEESKDLAQPTPLAELVEEIEKAREEAEGAESSELRPGGQ